MNHPLNPGPRVFRPELVPLPRQDVPKFPRTDRPIDLDCGCGVGWHIIQRAACHPERLVIGVEHTAEKFAKFAGRMAQHPHLSNGLAVHANAISWITHYVPSASVDNVFLMYPNPNPKPTQANKRWHNMKFAVEFERILKPGGNLYLATNCAFYIEEAKNKWQHNPCFSVAEFGEIDWASLESPRTHFEKKYWQRGETCYELTLTKR